MHFLVKIIHYIVQYKEVVITLLTIIFGIILSMRSDNSIVKKIFGAIVPIVALVIYMLVPNKLPLSIGRIGYIVAMMVIYLIFVSAIFVSFNLFAQYTPSRWVITLTAVMTLLCLVKTIYHSKLFFEMGSLMDGMSAGTTIMFAFLNSPKALDTISFLCGCIPALAVYSDAFSTIRKR